MGWSWLRRRADRGNAPTPAAITSPAPPTVPREPDWPHLSPVQRTLADPLTPVAPLDRFTSALATHQNPSFLSTLGHHVDPDGPGGLVTGLAVPRAGRPVSYAGTAELAVPPRQKPRPAVQRRVAGWSTPTETVEPASDPFPATSEGSSGSVSASVPEPQRSTDLSPVEPMRLEPGEGPSTSPGPIATSPLLSGDAPAVLEHRPEPVEGPSTSSGPTATARAVGNEPSTTAAGPAETTPLSFTAAVAPALSSGTPLPSIQRRLATVPDALPRTAGFPPPPTVTLPVVARSATELPAVVARTPTTPSSPPTAGPTVSSAAGSPAGGGEAGQSATDLDTTPVLAEAGPITVLPDPGTPTPEPATEAVPLAHHAEPDGVPSGAEFPASASLATGVSFPAPSAASPLDGFAGTPEAPAMDPEHVMGSPPASPVHPGNLPPAKPADRASAEDQPPIQQSLVGHAPPLVQRSPIARDKPVVQRTTADRTGPVAPFGPVEDGLAVAARRPAAQEEPATPLVESSEMFVRSTVDAVEPVGPTAPLSGFAARINALADDDPGAERVEANPLSGTGRTLPTVEDMRAEPVDVRPSPGSGRSAPPASSAPLAPVQRRVVVGPPVVQRSASPTVPPTPTASLVADRPPLSVRTDVSSAVDPAPSVQPVSFAPVAQSAAQPSAAPLVSRVAEPIRVSSPRVQAAAQPTPAHPRTPSGPQGSPAPTSMIQRSFAAMFAGSVGPDTGTAAEPSRSDDHPGFTTVQLQPADEPSPAPTPEPTPAAAPPPEGSPAPTVAAAPPTAGAAAADLDEMARRLFEPLSARLRAELWLDRERAGLVTDIRH